MLIVFSLLSGILYPLSVLFFYLFGFPPDYILSLFWYAMSYVFFFLFLFYKTRKENVMVNIPNERSAWKIYPLIFLLTSCGMMVTDHISSLIPQNGPIWEKMYRHINRLIENEASHPITMIISTVFLAPVCEEFFFRGILLNGLLHNKIHPIKAILFSSFLFGFMHMNPWQFVGGMLIGSLLGLVYFCTRSISNCILLHIFNNGLAVLILFYKIQYGSDPVTEFLNVNLWSFFIALGLAVVSGYILVNQTKKTWKNWSLSLVT